MDSSPEKPEIACERMRREGTGQERRRKPYLSLFVGGRNRHSGCFKSVWDLTVIVQMRLKEYWDPKYLGREGYFAPFLGPLASMLPPMIQLCACVLPSAPITQPDGLFWDHGPLKSSRLWRQISQTQSPHRTWPAWREAGPGSGAHPSSISHLWWAPVQLLRERNGQSCVHQGAEEGQDFLGPRP